MQTPVRFDSRLVSRYDVSGPRYTSYPTAPQFTQDFDAADYAAAVARGNAAARPLSLYVHIPFCDTVCFYCACNKVITRNRKRADDYLNRLYREIDHHAELFDRARPVNQLHFGGGTPTFIDDRRMQALYAHIASAFSLRDDGVEEYSIEIDPRTVDAKRMANLRRLGFNRVSLGVQDFNPAVQIAVNRLQSRRVTEDTIRAARAQGFCSVSLDLIYGLPLQTVASFSRTLEEVIHLAPDRIAVYNYAHLPTHFKTQRQINPALLPPPEVKLKILQQVVEQLERAGYVYIGMDHFARPDDPLAVAQREGGLQRNFQGYSTGAGCDLIGLGASAIGMVDDCYYQNYKELPIYHEKIDKYGLALWRGLRLSPDDRLRRAVIQRLMCDFQLDLHGTGDEYGVDFGTYFAPELQRLAAMQADGLLEMDEHAIRITPAGRLLVRNVCMVFDRYLNRGEQRIRYSRAI